MNRKRRKHKAMNALRRALRDHRILLIQLERELELEDMAMRVLNEKFPEFSAIFQTMPRLPMGWSLP